MKSVRFALSQLGLFFCGGLFHRVIIQDYKTATILGCIVAVLFMINTLLTIAISEKEKERLL